MLNCLLLSIIIDDWLSSIRKWSHGHFSEDYHIDNIPFTIVEVVKCSGGTWE